MASINDAEIEDFFEGEYVRGFADGETRVYEFDVARCKIQPKNDFNGKPTMVPQCVVRNPNSSVQRWKLWDLTRKHRKVWDELRHGNDGKGWTVMEITRRGLGTQIHKRLLGQGLSQDIVVVKISYRPCVRSKGLGHIQFTGLKETSVRHNSHRV